MPASLYARFSILSRGLRETWPLLATLLPCLFLQMGGHHLQLILRYERSAIAAGQWWRLFTGNFVHFGWGHLGLDLAGMVLLWLLVRPVLDGIAWVAATLVGAWSVGLGLWWGCPHVVWYLGISGVLHTYWACGGLLLTWRRQWEGYLLVLFLAGKLAWGHWIGPLPTDTLLMKAPVLSQAHWFGALAGVVLAAVLIGMSYRGSPEGTATSSV